METREAKNRVQAENPKTPTLLKPKGSATRKSQTSSSALTYWSGIIQPCVFVNRNRVETALHRIHVLTVQLRYDLLMTGFLLGQSSPWNLTSTLPNSLLSRKAGSYVLQPESSEIYARAIAERRACGLGTLGQTEDIHGQRFSSWGAIYLDAGASP